MCTINVTQTWTARTNFQRKEVTHALDSTVINTMTKSDLGRTGCVSSYGSDMRLHSWGSQEFKAGTWRREGRQRRNTAYWLAFPDSQPDFLYVLGFPTHSHQSRLYPTGLPIDQLFFWYWKYFFFVSDTIFWLQFPLTSPPIWIYTFPVSLENKQVFKE